MNNRTVFWTIAIVAGGLVAVGCNSKVTGGGSLQGLGGERASFSVNFDSCKGMDKAKGGFLYKDKNSALSVKGELVGISFPLNGECLFVDGAPAAPGAAVSYIAIATWESNDPKQPGRGEAILCVRDGGEGKKADSADFVSIALWQEGHDFPGSAPFHVNGGTIQGNMQSHDCP